MTEPDAAPRATSAIGEMTEGTAPEAPAAPEAPKSDEAPRSDDAPAAPEAPRSDSAARSGEAPGSDDAPGSGTTAARNPRGRAKKSALRSFIDWVVVIGVAVGLAVVVKAFLLQAFYIPSESMEPTLLIGDRVMVNKLSYRFGEPDRGDIVVFEPDPGAYSPEIKDLIKRVIGLPGETIEAIDGVVYVNGEPLTEKYLADGVMTYNLPKLVVPDDRVLLLGDNRQASQDGRGCRQDWLMAGKTCAADNWDGRIGPVEIDSLVGRAVVTVWPFGRAGIL